MTWTKLDDNFPEHPKVVGLSDRAFRLHVHALCYCNRNLTDGFIANDRLRVVSARVRNTEVVRELVTSRLWRVVDGGWIVHDYLDYQPSAKQVVVDRKAAAERKRRQREKGSGPAGSSTADPNGHGVSHTVTHGVTGADVTEGQEPMSRRESHRESRPPDPTRPVPKDIDTPSLATGLGADEAEGGSGYADEEPPEPDDDQPPDEPTAPGAMQAIDALLRKVCPPDKNRIYGGPRGDLVAALRGGADQALILDAIRQGAAGEGAFLRVGRALQAHRDGRLATGDRSVQPKPFETPDWVDEPPADPAVVAEEMARARAALGQ